MIKQWYVFKTIHSDEYSIKYCTKNTADAALFISEPSNTYGPFRFISQAKNKAISLARQDMARLRENIEEIKNTYKSEFEVPRV